jgi:hypothetical protein
MQAICIIFANNMWRYIWKNQLLYNQNYAIFLTLDIVINSISKLIIYICKWWIKKYYLFVISKKN